MPMNRAMPSDHRPNASGSNRGSVIRPRLARLVEALGPARLSHRGRPARPRPAPCVASRSRQSRGSEWSSTSSTVTAPTSRLFWSTTGIATRSYVAIRRVISVSGVLRSQRVDVAVDHAAEQLEPAARAAAAGSAPCPGSARSAWPSAARVTNTCAATAGDSCGSRMRASASATVASGVQDHRLGGHHAARGARRVAAAAGGPGRPRPAPSGRAAPPAPARDSSASRSAASSGSISSSTSAARSRSSAARISTWSCSGSSLEHVGEALVVERGGDLVAACVGQVLQGVGEVGRAHLLQHGEQAGRALGVRQADQPARPVPLDLVEVAAAAEPAGLLPYGDPGQRPLAAAARCPSRRRPRSPVWSSGLDAAPAGRAGPRAPAARPGASRSGAG